MKNPYLTTLLAFGIVMLGMITLTAVFYLLRALGRPRPAAAAAAQAQAQAQAEAELGEELVAVLTAAAREALQAPVKVHHVHVHREPTVERWSRAGRMDVMISHRVERKR